MFLQSNDVVVPDTHATVGYDESVSDGPPFLPSLYPIINLSLSVAPYSILPSVIFILTVYGVFPSVVYVFF